MTKYKNINITQDEVIFLNTFIDIFFSAYFAGHLRVRDEPGSQKAAYSIKDKLKIAEYQDECEIKGFSEIEFLINELGNYNKLGNYSESFGAIKLKEIYKKVIDENERLKQKLKDYGMYELVEGAE